MSQHDAATFVSVCDRSVRITGLPSFSDVQQMLQMELSMHGQQFDLFDDGGEKICSDDGIKTAVENGHSLCANLSDVSVHHMEHCREELSHLQWKLLRDQVAGVAEKLTQVGHRVQELSEVVSTIQAEHTSSNKRLKLQLEGMIENASEVGRHDLTQVIERVDSVSQSINSERSRRDFMKQTIDQQIQQLRDMISGDRSTRRTENHAMQSLIDEARQVTLDEARSRENLESRHTSDVVFLTDRIESLARSQAEKVQDLCGQMKSIANNVNQSLQDGNRSVLQVQSIVESTQIEATARFKTHDERYQYLASRVTEIGNREAMHFDDLQMKQRKMSSMLEQLLEQLRSEERGRGLMETRRIVEDGEKEERGRGLLKTRLVTEDVGTSAEQCGHLVTDAYSHLSGSHNHRVAHNTGSDLGKQSFESSTLLCSPGVGREDTGESSLKGIAATSTVGFTGNSISHRSANTRSPSPPIPLAQATQSLSQLADQRQLVTSTSARTPPLVSRHSFASPLVVNAPQRSLSPVSRYRTPTVLMTPSVPSIPCGWTQMRAPSAPRHRPTDEMPSVKGS